MALTGVQAGGLAPIVLDGVRVHTVRVRVGVGQTSGASPVHIGAIVPVGGIIPVTIQTFTDRATAGAHTAADKAFEPKAGTGFCVG